MKWFIVATVLLLTSCGDGRVGSERNVQSSNKDLKIEVVGSIDGCTIYRFDDGTLVHFVRCGDRVTTAWTQYVPCGRGCMAAIPKTVETIKR